jgi:protein-S-isoprenylcysteine O-methyltransferase Ste14
MFVRALFAFLALPGVVAFAVPIATLLHADHTRVVRGWALAMLIGGVVGLVWCVRDFYVSGKGTLAPWSPPQRLVIVGLYRYSRNPMYVSVLMILLGWAMAFDVTALLWYAIFIAIAFHLRVVLGEEPWLARTHGEEWTRYRSEVRRWI